MNINAKEAAIALEALDAVRYIKNPGLVAEGEAEAIIARLDESDLRTLTDRLACDDEAEPVPYRVEVTIAIRSGEYGEKLIASSGYVTHQPMLGATAAIHGARVLAQRALTEISNAVSQEGA